jgi:predicted kinase
MSSAQRKIAVLTCGVATSGKTTFAHCLATLAGAKSVHKDRIYRQLGVSSLPPPEPTRDRADRHVLQEIESAFTENELVVVDISLLEQYRRSRMLAATHKLAYACVLVVFPSPTLQEARTRLAKKKQLFELTGGHEYSTFKMGNYVRSTRRFEKPSETEIAEIAVRGAYIEFRDSRDDTKVQVNEHLLPCWQQLEESIRRAYQYAAAGQVGHLGPSPAEL